MEDMPEQMFLLCLVFLSLIPGLLCPCSCVIIQQGSTDPGSLLCISSHLRFQPSISQQGQHRILMWLHPCLGGTLCLAAAKLPVVLQSACRPCTCCFSVNILNIAALAHPDDVLKESSEVMISTFLRKYRGTWILDYLLLHLIVPIRKFTIPSGFSRHINEILSLLLDANIWPVSVTSNWNWSQPVAVAKELETQVFRKGAFSGGETEGVTAEMNQNPGHRVAKLTL